MNQLGYYGKTPHRGDFVRFNLPQAFLKVWDDWLLQVMIHGESHCEDWADIYTRAPAWRFALSSGIAGNTPWIGVLRPSHDKVGRRFPFCLAVSLAEDAMPCVSVSAQALWLDEADTLLSRVVASDYRYDDLQGDLTVMADKFRANSREASSQVSSSVAPSVDVVTISTMSANALFSNDTLSAILDAVLQQTLGEYSVWIANAATNTTVINAGLPIDNAGLALFNSDWAAASTMQIDTAMLSSLSGLATSLPPGIDEAPALQIRNGTSTGTAAKAELNTDDASSDEMPAEATPDASDNVSGNDAIEKIPSPDDWAALDRFSDTSTIVEKVIVPEVEPLELDEDDVPDAPWES